MTAPQQFSVVPYDFDRLVDLLIEHSEREFVLSKTHSVYFEGYFKELGAKTIVVEKDYIDHDYLEDYTAYYVRCFADYPRKTRRLHFFSIEFDAAKFAAILRGEDSATLGAISNSDAYLGFVVVKPLPQTLVGRTCLKTYPSDNGRRHFPILQEYSSNLFGISLSVKTIAFQEQDSVVAACATSALWSVFQGTGQVFHHWIPSPAEITRIATNHIPEELAQILPETRGMPNKGLTASQMARATLGVGLEPYLVGSREHSVLQGTVYAYLRARIPMILVFSLVEIDAKTNSETVVGRHGVAVTGYSQGKTGRCALGSTTLYLKACRIDRLYVHDDQVGPFARMQLIANQRLDTSWYVRQARTVHAIPEFLLIPLYHKIRIPYEKVESAVLNLNAIMDFMVKGMPNVKLAEFEWDIYLITVNDFKSEIMGANSLSPEDRENLLTMALPKYLWRATAYMNGALEADLLFDATDIEQRGGFICALKYQLNVTGLFRAFSVWRSKPGSPSVSFGPMVERALAQMASTSP